MTPFEKEARDEMIRLGQRLALSEAQLAIAGEGNMSCRLGTSEILVTASGSRLASLEKDHLVTVRTARLWSAVDEELSDQAWLEVIMDSRREANDLRPTVEVGLHAVISNLLGAEWILHAHPVDVLALACSDRLETFAQTRLFPDHVVALGPADLWLPYIDPGRPLALAVRDGIRGHVHKYRVAPRAILLGNHGAFVVGTSAAEAMDRMLMLAKAARVFMNGGTSGMTAEAVARIGRREDESYRQKMLSAAGARA